MSGGMELSNAPKRVLIVGAGGFVGGFMVAEALRRGYETWAGVRATTNRGSLTDNRIRFIEFDFEDPTQIAEALREAMPGGRWDYIIYNLGATKVMRYADFSRINYDYLRYFTGALHSTGRIPDKLLYMSSLSVVGPYDERGYSPITEDVISLPNTKYGASKLKSEIWLATCGIPYIIFRATGVYGPHDMDYYMMFKSISRGLDVSVGFRKQVLTFIYVEDLARAAFDALEKGASGEVYNITESRAYTQKEFRKLAMSALGKRVVMPLRLPLWAVRIVSAISEKWGVAHMKAMTLNNDKFKIMRQRNWNCSGEKARKSFGFEASTSLREGIQKTVAWYRRHGWL
ncbi:MAG: NAD(P)-dependent oxidoreductase [Candidatus Amulumruptor caecigallinarius]|nr:NAD(P)-dependent oxidoreductase [Candidatus Amulumruptor caecigallinarius]